MTGWGQKRRRRSEPYTLECPLYPQKRTWDRHRGNVRLVPIAVVSNCSKLGHYSITSSARASRVGDTSSPSALARPPSPREAYDFVHHAPQLRNRCLLNQGGFKTPLRVNIIESVLIARHDLVVLDHLGPARDLAVDEGAECLGGRHAKDHALLGQAPLHRRLLQGLAHGGVHARDDLAGRLGRRQNAPPG